MCLVAAQFPSSTPHSSLSLLLHIWLTCLLHRCVGYAIPPLFSNPWRNSWRWPVFHSLTKSTVQDRKLCTRFHQRLVHNQSVFNGKYAFLDLHLSLQLIWLRLSNPSRQLTTVLKESSCFMDLEIILSFLIQNVAWKNTSTLQYILNTLKISFQILLLLLLKIPSFLIIFFTCVVFRFETCIQL